ncbi:hypothetical protein PHYSODRAFT_256576 [Phytophthora sojae]|uniref:Uncharacterized protein n=1 Tax=Phytophthora sojae (strain P6497) TaxID=1094619 RepID=G4Z019_PHYSP|nr:hypothetical protein PHYSODRAFT_256576 [Phytophthora sojae]EGZ23959.1 hypothetical protein PHYSODRAFT_256576 [Phytophthora sojae]|eukprot:XP_009519247.1 hypothetical protein PHYSODRAFT_256576 [Phytophthora sojae]
MTNKRKGVICTFPQCNKTLTTSKFKQHFARHLKEGESYDVSHRDRYERALDDASLLPEGQDEESSSDEEEDAEDANEDEREEADKDADVEMETPASAGDVDGADDGPKSPETQRRVLRALRNLR